MTLCHQTPFLALEVKALGAMVARFLPAYVCLTNWFVASGNNINDDCIQKPGTGLIVADEDVTVTCQSR